jgi:peptidoglycan/xylan/chitin deacetylase (PgdA/CDA1 family)
MKRVLIRLSSKYRRTAAKHLFRRIITLRPTKPIISFSFDDAPRTAFARGGDMLGAHGARGTFYVSLGMLGRDSPSGVIGTEDDLRLAIETGHELGCHTFDHRSSWETSPGDFLQAVLKNREAVSGLFPEASMSTFAYPICDPRPATKRRIGKMFRCCRGGGQTFNVGKTDLNLLKAFFLDARNLVKIDTVRELLDKNAEARGWLIFATHDIADNPSRYGCSNQFFRDVVKHAAQSGALILPVAKAFEQVQC